MIVHERFRGEVTETKEPRIELFVVNRRLKTPVSVTASYFSFAPRQTAAKVWTSSYSRIGIPGLAADQSTNHHVGCSTNVIVAKEYSDGLLHFVAYVKVTR